MNSIGQRPSTLERANNEMAKAVFGPYTAGANAVAGMMNPYGMSWMAFLPPAAWPGFLGTVYMQGTAKGIMDAPRHYMEAMSLYTRAASEGARATR